MSKLPAVSVQVVVGFCRSRSVERRLFQRVSCPDSGLRHEEESGLWTSCPTVSVCVPVAAFLRMILDMSPAIIRNVLLKLDWYDLNVA